MFKLGDEVISIRYPHWGVGKVIKIVMEHDRPLVVEFPNLGPSNVSKYTLDGTQGGPVRIRLYSKLYRALL